MLQRHAGKIFTALLPLVLLAGCSDGTAGTAKGGDDFDQDDIQVTITDCASKGSPAAVARVTASTSPSDRTYYVGLEFLDSEGNVVDSSSQKLTPESDSGDDEITAKVKFPMTERKKAGEVASCKLKHAF